MSGSLGDFDTSAIIYGKFTTYRPSTGAPYALAGTPALSVYKDNGVTQSTSGITLTTDFDTVTGLNHFAIDTSLDGTFYSAGSFFDIVITTGTVDSVSAVGTVVGRFTLRKTADLKPTTAGRTLDVSAGGEAGIDWANVGGPTTVVGLTGTTVKTATDVETDTADIQSRLPAALTAGGNIKADALAISGDTVAADNAELAFDGTGYGFTGCTIPTVTTLTGHTAQTGDCYARLGAPAGASVSADVAAVKSDSAAILDDTGTSGVVLVAAERQSVENGQAQAGNANSITLRAAATATNDLYIGQKISIYAGTGSGQTRGIANYNGTTKVATVARNWTTAPDATSYYRIEFDFGPKVNTNLEVFLNNGGGDLTSIPWNAAWDAEVQSEVADALDAVVPGTPTANSINERIKALDDAYTAARAAYIDNINNAALATTSAQTGDAFARLGAPAGASIAADVAAILTTALTEGYRGAGATGTAAQLLYEIIAHLGESSISGTTKTLKKLDGSTTAKTYTLNDATTPTSITETT